MARRLFFADLLEEGAAAPLQRAVVRGAEARHLAQVLRARPGMQFELAAGGQRYLGAVAVATPAQVTFDLLQRLDAAAPAAAGPRLLAAIFKFDRFEWMLEKATELGAAAIQPLAAGRSEPRLVAAAAARRDRWRRIVQAAAQQSRRQDIPAIAPVANWAELDGPPPQSAAQECRLLLAEDAAAPPLAAALLPGRAAIMLAVGPEGGWTEGDRAAAAALSFLPFSLGPRILRAETAAIAALAYLSVRTAGSRPAEGA